MGLNISLDTNIFIDVKNKDDSLEYSSKILDRIDSGELKCILSTVVIAEMCAGYHMTGELLGKDDILDHVVTSRSYEIVPVSTSIADDAGRIRAAAGLKLPDAIVVASAVSRGADLLISNDESLKKAAKLI